MIHLLVDGNKKEYVDSQIQYRSFFVGLKKERVSLFDGVRRESVTFFFPTLGLDFFFQPT